MTIHPLNLQQIDLDPYSKQFSHKRIASLKNRSLTVKIKQVTDLNLPSKDCINLHQFNYSDQKGEHARYLQSHNQLCQMLKSYAEELDHLQN
ncbi:MAG: hypothetical protein K0S74_110 [Chlamydiales bacterium]|jgi:hypothetical protein|nr:hypothetical protein [Chlamydiales bacterium]